MNTELVSAWLVPGEMRVWTLRANLYWFELEADSATQATLQFGTTGFNCSVGRAAERALSCITRGSGRVVVRHLGLRTTSADATVRMREYEYKCEYAYEYAY